MNSSIPSDIPSSSRNKYYNLPLALINLSQGPQHIPEAPSSPVLDYLDTITQLTTQLSPEVDEKLTKNNVVLQEHIHHINTFFRGFPGVTSREIQK